MATTTQEEEPHDPQLEEINAEGHWKCTKCSNWNFSTRTVCNMRKCMYPRGGNLGVTIDDAASKKLSRLGSLGDDWICKLCKNVNYKQRTHCNRRSCGAPREEWQCHCGNWNFPQRTHCNMKKCNLPRPSTAPAPQMASARYTPYQRMNAMEPAQQQLSAFFGNAILEDLDKIDISHLPPAAALQLLQSAQQALLQQQQHQQQQQQQQNGHQQYAPPPPNGMPYQPQVHPAAMPMQPQAGDPYHMMGQPGPMYHRGPPPPQPMQPPPQQTQQQQAPQQQQQQQGGNNSSRREKRPMRPGEWVCPVCDNINFAERLKCNMRTCGTPKPANV